MLGALQHRRTRTTTLLAVVAVCLCAFFWIGEPSWNREVFGRYSAKWFGLAVVSNLLILAALTTRIRSVWTRQRAASTNRRRLSMAKRTCFGIVVLLPVLVTVEFGLRHFYFPPPPRPFRPEAGTAGGYHASLQHVDRIYEDGQWRRAYRGRTYTFERTTTFRIVCLGGSTTWGHHLEPDQTWPRILEESLIALGYDVEVINAGRPWYTTVHSITNYTTHMRYYDPDLVILMHGVNDLTRGFPGPGEPPAEWDYGSYQGPMRNVLSGYRANNRKTSLADWHPIKLARSSAIYRLALNCAVQRRSEPDVNLGRENFLTLDPFLAHLEYLAQLCLDDHCAVVLATQAHIYDRVDLNTLPTFDSTMRETYMRTRSDAPVSAASLRSALKIIRESVLDVARFENIPVADAQQAIGGNAKYFIDDFHLNPEGNSVTARVVLEVVRPVLDGLLAPQAFADLNGS